MAFTPLNTFAPDVMAGDLALANGNNPNVLTLQFSPTVGNANDTLKAGDAVIFQDGKSSVPLIRAAAEDEDSDIVGVVAFGQRKDTLTAGDLVEVYIRGTIIWLKATEDVARGEQFGKIGVSLDDAAAGEFTKVSIGGLL